MPTKKKRVGFIPREEVMRIIEKMSIENNLSNSKIISILVEEALSTRGIFNKITGKAKQTYQENNQLSEYLDSSSGNSKDNNKLSTNSKLNNYKILSRKNIFDKTNNEDIDLQNYKKFLSFLRFQEMMDEYNI